MNRILIIRMHLQATRLDVNGFFVNLTNCSIRCDGLSFLRDILGDQQSGLSSIRSTVEIRSPTTSPPAPATNGVFLGSFPSSLLRRTSLGSEVKFYFPQDRRR